MNVLGKMHGAVVFDRRVRRLTKHLSELIPASHSMLDVGCGDGRLAWSLLQSRRDLRIEGVDVLVRERTWVPVKKFDGERLPYPDSTFDAVMLIDVLHHTREPIPLLREAVRASKGLLIVKDHVRSGLTSKILLRFMDYAGNSSHGVALPYNYFSLDQWKDLERALRLEVLARKTDLGLYTWPIDYVFGSKLHFIALYKTKECQLPQSP